MELNDTRKNWQRLGARNPFFSILTRKEKRDVGWQPEEFFATGREEIRQAFAYIASLGLSPRRSRALDFGCGVGRLTQALADHCNEVVGVDIAASMIRHAEVYNRKGARCRYATHTSNNLSLFPADHFDFVYSTITLQHIEPRYARRYVEEFARVLAPGGILFFQLPSERATPPPSLPPLRRAVKSFIPAPLLAAYYRTKHVFRPVLEMHAIPRDEVTAILTRCGLALAGSGPDNAAGDQWKSFHYCAVKPERAAPR